MSLVLENVHKDVGAQAHIRDVSLALEKGVINVLLGPTQSGKTSLMRLMAGLDRPTGGRIAMNERDVTMMPLRKRSVAMVYQQFINYPFFTVFENIASPLRVAGLRASEIETRVREAAKLLKLESYLDRSPLQLSGGQQQRTAIARALVNRPKILFADEPTGNLDSATGEAILTLLREIQSTMGMTIVMVTHERHLAETFADRLATMGDGKLLSITATEARTTDQSAIHATTYGDRNSGQ